MDWDWNREVNAKAAAILRVSSAKQEGNTSTLTQKKAIQRYCSENGLKLVHIAELTESAKDADQRDGYDEAISYAIKNKIKHVLFYMNDREARNLTNIEANNKLIRAGKIIIHHVQDRRVYWEGSSPSDFLMRNINGAINSDFSLRLSVKINDSTIAKAEMGWWPGNKPPLGYVCIRELNAEGRETRGGIAKIVRDPNPLNVQLVQREFELRAAGLSINAIRARIMEEGFHRGTKLKAYSRTGIEERLNHKFYWGYFDWKDKQYNGIHELIIPRHILSAVKASFQNDSFVPLALGARDSIFGKWIRCGADNCGSPVTYDPATKVNQAGEKTVYNYYRCYNSAGVHPDKKGMYITEEKILDLFEPAVEGISITRQFGEDILNAIKDADAKTKVAIKSQSAGFKKALKELEAKEDLAYEHFTSGVLDSAGYKRQLKRLRDEKEHYADRLESVNLMIAEASHATLEQIIELCIDAKSIWKSAPKEKRADYLKKITSNPLLDGGTIRYSYHKPFAVISEMRGNPLWWRLTGSNR